MTLRTFDRTAFGTVAQSVLAEQPDSSAGTSVVGTVVILDNGTYGPHIKYRSSGGSEGALQASSFLVVAGVCEVRTYWGSFVNLMGTSLREGRTAAPYREWGGYARYTRDDYPVLPGERCRWNGRLWEVVSAYGLPEELCLQLQDGDDQELVRRDRFSTGHPWIVYESLEAWSTNKGTVVDAPVLVK